jgi:3'(2'), 5'-bisphosphate nucleotidase
VDIDISILIGITQMAGEKIKAIYDAGEIEVDKKADNSPLTAADRASHDLIFRDLTKSFPGIPVLSEEGSEVPYHERKHWNRFWLVDPLDGTKEFIHRNGEFTVNIALIEDNLPVLGVIYTPIHDTIYYAQKGKGAFKRTGKNSDIEMGVRRETENGLIAVRSRSHSSDEENAFLHRHHVTDSISVGSSLKFCMIAEGKAHLYYRHGPTMEWDTAAGHAIAEGAGAVVSGLTYNKETLKNGSFIVASVPLDELT